MSNENKNNSKMTVEQETQLELRTAAYKAVRLGCTAFRDINNPNAIYVEIKRNDKSTLCLAADGEEFVSWVRQQTAIIKSPNELVSKTVQEYIDEARFGPIERTVAIRAGRKGDTWYYNLADTEGRVVKITEEGWTIETSSDVKFVRTLNSQPMATPDRTGTLEDLRRFVRVRDQEWPLYVAYLLMSLSPVGPYPLVALVGEHGSGKTVAEQVTSLLIDPATESVGPIPKSDRELTEMASRRWLLAFDNLSVIPKNMSDALCRMSTGTGTFLNEDSDISVRRPVMFTSIDDLNLENDLLDRTVWLAIPPLKDSERMADAKFWEEFKQLRGKILGALFNLLVEVRKNLPNVNLSELPRMADYAKLGCAVESALGLPTGGFMARYRANRAAVAEMLVESNPFANLIKVFLLARRTWTGSAQELMLTLSQFKGAGLEKAAAEMKSPRQLASALRRVAPSLRRVGVDVEFERTAEERTIKLCCNRDLTDEEKRQVVMLNPGEKGIKTPEDSLWYVLEKKYGKYPEEQKKLILQQIMDSVPPEPTTVSTNDGHDDHDDAEPIRKAG